MSRDWLIGLYLGGGALEFLGIAIVVAEVLTSRRLALKLRNPPPDVHGGTVIRRSGGLAAAVRGRRDPALFLAAAQDQAARQATAASINTYKSLVLQRAALLEVLTGTLRWRALGVALLLVGVVVSTIANVSSTSRTQSPVSSESAKAVRVVILPPIRARPAFS